MLPQIIIFIVFGVGWVLSAPQLLTFKDGNIGVNFGGYSAQAGLGGILTGNAAHGGLSASAGTPWNANAAAGISGSVKGDVGGAAYAGAKLGDDIGASSVISGSTGSQQSGFLGAESYANGNVALKTVALTPQLPSVSSAQGQQNSSPNGATVTKHVLFTKEQFNSGNVQKVKPPKKYTPETNASVVVEQKPDKKNITIEVTSDSKSDALNQPKLQPILQTEPVFINFHQLKHHFHPATRRRLHLKKQVLFSLPMQHLNFEQQQSDPNFTQHKSMIKTVYRQISPVSQTSAPLPQIIPDNAGHEENRSTFSINSGFLKSAFNIPIGILASIRDNLQLPSVKQEIK